MQRPRRANVLGDPPDPLNYFVPVGVSQPVPGSPIVRPAGVRTHGWRSTGWRGCRAAHFPGPILYNTSKQQQAAADLLLDLTKSLQSEMLSDGDQTAGVVGPSGVVSSCYVVERVTCTTALHV